MKTQDFVKVESLEHALQLNLVTMEEFNHRTQFDTDGQRAGKELEEIAYAINGGRVMGHDEERHYPCFGGYLAVFDFEGSYCIKADLRTDHHLTVCSAAAAYFFGTQHLPIWKRYVEGK